MRKFFVKDEDENINYSVEEVADFDEEPEVTEEVTDDDETDALTADEIAALKKLASVADKLVELINTNTEDADENEDVVEEESDEESITDEFEEEVIDTDETLTHDSVRSFGAIEKHIVADSIEDEQDAIAAAWAKRYGGKI